MKENVVEKLDADCPFRTRSGGCGYPVFPVWERVLLAVPGVLLAIVPLILNKLPMRLDEAFARAGWMFGVYLGLFALLGFVALWITITSHEQTKGHYFLLAIAPPSIGLILFNCIEGVTAALSRIEGIQ